MKTLVGQLTQRTNLVGRLSKPTGENSDHKIVALKYAYDFIKTTIKNYISNRIKGGNLLTLEQGDLSNWTKNMNSFPQFDNEYADDVNNITYKGGGGCERIYHEVNTETGKQYSFEFDFKTSTGFECDYGSTLEYAFVSSSVPSSSLTDLLNDTSVIAKTALNNTASDNTTHYSVDFIAVQTPSYIGIDMGYITDNVVTNLYFSNIRLYPINVKYESEETT